MLSAVSRFILYSLLLVLLSACSAYSPTIPKIALKGYTPRQVLVTEIKSGRTETLVWQVVMQPQGDSLRWLRFNLLGAPDARQILENGQWRNEGFIWPNPEARELFTALLVVWTNPTDFAQAYPSLSYTGYRFKDLWTLKENGKLRWTITWQDGLNQADSFSITDHNSGTIWQVRPL